MLLAWYPKNLDQLGTGEHIDKWGHPFHYVRVADVSNGKLRHLYGMVPVNDEVGSVF